MTPAEIKALVEQLEYMRVVLKSGEERPDCGCGLGAECPDPPQSNRDGYAAGISMMLAHEQCGGEGWWRGWEMVKDAHAKPTHPAVEGEAGE